LPIDRLIQLCEAGVTDGVFPAYGFAVGTRDQVWMWAGGSHLPVRDVNTAINDWFDLASLTKVLVTTPRVREFLPLDAPVCEFWPAFGKPEITVRNLLLHESGLPAHRELWEQCASPEDVWPTLATMPLEYETGTEAVYSCMGFLVLGHGLAVVGAPDPNDWLVRHYGTQFLRFNPPADARCLATEFGLSGRVHDENARFLGGVAGNAGLFGTVEGVAIAAQKILRSEPRVWTERASAQSTRALGWDTKSETGSSAGEKFGPKAFGHTGFTGTSLWVDPEVGIFGALLTNRVNPTRENLKIQEFRPRFYDAVFDALT